MKNFFFTIFTPVYNGESYIHRAFESIHNSEYRNFEWIIINDGSLDKSDDVIKTLIRDSEVDVIYINCNGKGEIFSEKLQQNQRFCGETGLFRQTIFIIT